MKYNLEDCIEFSEITTCLLGAWEYRITTWEYIAFAAIKKGLELVALVWITVWAVATDLFWFHKKWWACIGALLTILVHVSQNKGKVISFLLLKNTFLTPILSLTSGSLTWRKRQNDSDKKYINIYSVYLSLSFFFFYFLFFYLFCNWLLTQQFYKNILRGFLKLVILPLLS